jgi:hypothetical protein
MLPRHLFNLLRLNVQNAANQATTGDAATGLERLRAGLQWVRREIAWEQVLLLAGLAVAWWSIRELMALFTSSGRHPALQAIAVAHHWPCRCFPIALSGFLGFVAMFSGLTLGFLELLIVGEIRKLRAEAARRPPGASHSP